MEKQVWSVVGSILRQYWYWILVAFLGLGGVSWAWGKISRQRSLLKAAQERISWQDTQLRSQRLRIKQLENDVHIERLKHVDKASAARIEQLKKQNVSLQKERAQIDQTAARQKQGIKKMSLDKLNKLINEE